MLSGLALEMKCLSCTFYYLGVRFQEQVVRFVLDLGTMGTCPITYISTLDVGWAFFSVLLLACASFITHKLQRCQTGRRLP